MEGQAALNRIDLTGKRFGRLVVMGFSHTEHKGNQWRAYWKCLCDCGNQITLAFTTLVSGNNKSCGCYNRDMTIERNFKHGHSPRGNRTKANAAWNSMIQRCNNPNNTSYAIYGGRGIKVCARWLGECGFINFLSDMGEPPSDTHEIDRIDCNGDYEPSNCRWVTEIEQARNKRNTVYFTLDDITKCSGQWSEIVGIKASTLRCRKRKGWSDEKILTTPLLTNQFGHYKRPDIDGGTLS